MTKDTQVAEEYQSFHSWRAASSSSSSTRVAYASHNMAAMKYV